MTDFVNAEAVRQAIEPMAKAAASAAVREFVAGHPHFASQESQKAEMTTFMKLVIGVGGTIVAAAIIWMAATLNQLQITVARIDERQLHDTTGKRLDAVEQADVDLANRISSLERFHPATPKG